MGAMKKGELLALAERCEKATGPDRELDALIWRATARDYAARMSRASGLWPKGFDPVDEERRWGGLNAPKFTASLDAAMTLVPTSMALIEIKLIWELPEPGAYPACSVEWYPPFKSGLDWHALTVGAATPALTLTAACLRALAEKETPDD